MLDYWAFSVIEKIEGRRLPSIVADRLHPIVTERTAFNWLKGVTRNSPIPDELLRKQSEDFLRKKLISAGWSEEEAYEVIKNAPTGRGILAMPVYMSAVPDGNYPETLALAVWIDAMSEKMWRLRGGNDLEGFKNLLRSAKELTHEYWVDPDTGLNAEDQLREQVESAEAWVDLERPFKYLMANTVFSFLACWDVEFCANYIREFEARSMFKMLLPRIDPMAKRNDDGIYPWQPEIIQLPVRRLIDLMGCLRYYARRREWPSGVPPVGEIAKWMREDCRKVTLWRMGRKFTVYDFERIWHEMYSFRDPAPRPKPPFPLIYASTAWSALLVKGSREQKNITFHYWGAGEDSVYDVWWQRHLTRLKTKGITFGETPWTKLLD